MEINLKIRRITNENFCEYGEIIDISGEDPTFTCSRFEWYDRLGAWNLGKASFGMVCPVYTGDFSQPVLERHKGTNEIVIPLDEDVVVVVGKPDALEKSEPDKEDFGAFYVARGQAVVFSEGIWHEAPMTFAEKAKVIVVYRDGTGEEDKQLVNMEDVGLKINAVI